MASARSIGRAAPAGRNRRQEDDEDMDHDMDIDQVSGPDDRPKDDKPDKKQEDQVKKPRKPHPPRPKLTLEILEGPKGFDDVFTKFPESFKTGFRGKGHEISDLQRLLEMYSRWQQRVFPHKSFDEFIVTLEKLSASSCLKMAMRQRRQDLLNLVLVPEAEAEAEAATGYAGEGAGEGVGPGAGVDPEGGRQRRMDAWGDDDDEEDGGGRGGSRGGVERGQEELPGAAPGPSDAGVGREPVAHCTVGARTVPAAAVPMEEEEEEDYGDYMDEEEARRQEAEEAALEALGEDGGWGDDDEPVPRVKASAKAASQPQRPAASQGAARGGGRLAPAGQAGQAAHIVELEDHLEDDLEDAPAGTAPAAGGAAAGGKEAPAEAVDDSQGAAAAGSEQGGGSGSDAAGAEELGDEDEEKAVGTQGTQGRLSSRVRQVLMDDDEDDDEA